MNSAMALFVPTLTLLLVAAAIKEAYGCVCYVGQEPDQATDKRYGWSLAEQRPCECTEFRLGGINIKPQIKPYEVKIGGDISVPINEQGQSNQFHECKDDQPSRCNDNTYRFNGAMELQLQMTSPIRLAFTVTRGGFVKVHFSTEGPGIAYALYQVDLDSEYASIYKRDSSSSPPWKRVQFKNGNYIGVPVIITHDNHRFKVTVSGVQDSTVMSDVTPSPQQGWFVSFDTYNAVELRFTEPCIDDFEPKLYSL